MKKLFFSVGLVIIFISASYGVYKIFDAQKPILFEAKVNLVNECEYPNYVFMVKSKKYKSKGYFFDKNPAKIRTDSKDIIILMANDRFPKFDYNGPSARSKKIMKMTATCGSNSQSMKDIFAR